MAPLLKYAELRRTAPHGISVAGASRFRRRTAYPRGRILDLPSKQAKGNPMSKGMDQKRETKKKPAKTFGEKRAAKREKRQARGR